MLVYPLINSILTIKYFKLFIKKENNNNNNKLLNKCYRKI
jgi:hypothetical protein